MDKDRIIEGIIKDYNTVPVTQRKMYYDRDETDKDAQSEFAANLENLTKFNTKLKELDKKADPKITDEDDRVKKEQSTSAQNENWSCLL